MNLRNTVQGWDADDELPVAEWARRVIYNPCEWNDLDDEENCAVLMDDDALIQYVFHQPDPDNDLPEEENGHNSTDFLEVSFDLGTAEDCATIDDSERQNDLKEHRNAVRMLTALEQYFQNQEDGE